MWPSCTAISRFDEGDTEESLKAEYEALSGEAYRSQEEEQAANVEAAKERGSSGLRRSWTETAPSSQRPRPTDSSTAVRFGMRSGWDKPNAKGVYHSSLSVAVHWIEKAGEEVVYLIPRWHHGRHQERADGLLS